tara:strand:+ start:158 stop:445 length:288 start_codon:yes stop_codon:yes gene_type:complete
LLIENSKTKNTIVSLKLVTGDEVVGKIVDDSETHLTISKPLTVMMSDKGLAMLPFMISVSADEKVILQKQHCVCTSKPVNEVEKHYIQITTGITL